MTETPKADERTAHLLRLLRGYADSRLGPKLAETFREFGDTEGAGLVALEEGSDERIVQSVCAGVHRILSEIVSELYIEIGTVRLDAKRAIEDLGPEDFGGEFR